MFSPPGAVNTQAFGLNDSGQVVGSFAGSDGHQVGFLYSAGTFTTIQVSGAVHTQLCAINNAGEIVGSDFIGGHNHGLMDSNGAITAFDVPGATDTIATAINSEGQIAGYYTDSNNVDHGFVDNNGVFTTIDVPGANYTQVIGINDAGQLVGAYYDDFASRSGEHGFLYNPAPEPKTSGLIGLTSILACVTVLLRRKLHAAKST